MPFKGTCPVEERIALFRDLETSALTVVELCERYGVSRQTFYEWKERRASGEAKWYEERSHAALCCPHATPEAVRREIVAVRQRFPHFGPKKIRAWLSRERPAVAWPAASTMGDILKREGLVTPRRRRRRALAQGTIAPAALAPNAEWAIDFKGWFRTADGARCDPLTVTDTASRYLLEVRIVDPTYAGVRGALERVFEACGLPGAIRSDNGSPFGSTGAGGLSQLSVWWLKLGIEPHYIRPAKPQENGRHERMHKTLKAHTASTPAAHREQQQTRFDIFRAHYNEERPHEALGQTPPAGHWQPSSRRLPKQLAEPWYDAGHEMRRVHWNGEIRWRGEAMFIGEALAGEPVGIAEIDDGLHAVRFATRDLGIIGRDRRFRRFAPPRARLRSAAETPQDDAGTQPE